MASKHSHKDTPKVTRDKNLSKELKKQLKGHTTNPVTSFCYMPSHTNFIEADKEEKIILLLRRHPITNIPWIFISIVMLMLPVFVGFINPTSMLPLNILIVLSLFWYLVTFMYIFEQFVSWFFNVYIITDERVFDVDFYNLVFREISDANIDQIQDVTVTVSSVVRTIFDYGTLTIQTAAQIPQIEFEDVPSPDQVAQVLRELRVEEEIERLEGRVR